MKTCKSRLLAGALALVASPLLATPQGASDQQADPSGPPAASQPQAQVQPNQNAPGRRHHRRHHRRRHHRRHPRKNASFLLREPAARERVGISAEQAANIQAQQGEFTKAMIRDRADVHVKRLEGLELLAAEKPDALSSDRKLAQLKEVQFGMRRAAIEHRLTIREIFSPEQREDMRHLFRKMCGGGRLVSPHAPGEPGAFSARI